MAIGTSNKVDANAPIGKQKKKKHIALWITLSILLIVVVLPISLVYGCFFDPSHNETGVTEVEDPTSIFTSTFCNLVENCDPTIFQTTTQKPSMDIVITQKMLNELLFYATNSIPEEIKSFVPQISFIIDDTVYKFDIEVNAYNIFKTNLYLDLKCSANQIIETQENKKGFILAVDNVTIGRIGGLKDIAFNILSSTGLLDSITQIFAGCGLEHMIFEKENSRFVYTYDGFISDICKLANMSESSLLIGVLDELLNKTDAEGNPFFNFNHTKNSEIRGTGFISEFVTNSTYCKDSYTRSFPTRSKLDSVISAIKAHQKANPGANWSNEELIKIIQFVSYGNNVDSSLIGDDVITSFFTDERRTSILGGKTLEEYSTEIKGTYFPTVANLKDVLETQVKSQVTPEFMTKVYNDIEAHEQKISFNQIKVSDELLNDQFQAIGLMGQGTAFHCGDGDSYDCNYMMPSEVYTTIMDNQLNIIIRFDVNGTVTSLIMPMKADEQTESGKFKFNSGSEVYWGTYKCGSGITNLFNSLKSELDQFSIEGISFQDGNLAIDCDAYVQQGLDDSGEIIPGSGTTIDDYAKSKGYTRFTKLSAIGPTSTDNKGYITVDISYSLSA